jgi:probable HAF family extracellular repeat protein
MASSNLDSLRELSRPKAAVFFVKRSMKALFVKLLVAFGLVNFGSYLFAETVVLTDLGAGMIPSAINNSGQVVGQGANGQAFLWSNGSYQNLGTVGGTASNALAINDHGVIAGWSLDQNNSKKAFRYENNTMTNLDAGWIYDSVAESINNQGDIVGWRTNGIQFGSVRWEAHNGQSEFLFTEHTGNQKAMSINDDGEMVGLLLNGSGTMDESYYWTGRNSSGNFSERIERDYYATAGINSNSLTAGSRDSFSTYLQIGSSNLSVIPKLNANDISKAYGLNDQGQIVGASGNKGYIFDVASGKLVNVNDYDFSGFNPDSVVRLTDINNQGRFTGVAVVDGVEHGVTGQVVTPEPTTLAMMVAGAGAVVIWLLLPKKAVISTSACSFTFSGTGTDHLDNVRGFPRH